jgi:hypothetical protein
MLTANQTVQDVYVEIIRKLPSTARLQLATLILGYFLERFYRGYAARSAA